MCDHQSTTLWLQRLSVMVQVMLWAHWPSRCLWWHRDEPLWPECQLVVSKLLKRPAPCYLLVLPLTQRDSYMPAPAESETVEDKGKGKKKNTHCKKTPAIAMVLKSLTWSHMIVMMHGEGEAGQQGANTKSRRWDSHSRSVNTATWGFSSSGAFRVTIKYFLRFFTYPDAKELNRSS